MIHRKHWCTVLTSETTTVKRAAGLGDSVRWATVHVLHSQLNG
ncbi:hypothetical protein pphageT12_06 [Pseudomonas phage pphageT12]|nr:hypothetical protein pphageB21_06 [Pseudomonas phage pphageB21]UAW53698.1 hypothetical protein pphageT21_06 [Pseudomonas phage pphageT21]UAW53757.1 hypothetical protein pphageT12_06 [Pseudomonas phage pphageT12]UAW53818.1 hypothetical protein pphageBV72_06 [Pseudomonas phage pphageBV72]